MLKDANELLGWLKDCPEGRSVTLRYASEVDYIDVTVLRNMATAMSEEELFIPPVVDGARLPGHTYLDAIEAPARPMSNARITGLEPAGEPEPEPIKRLASPLRDPKLDWLRSKG